MTQWSVPPSTPFICSTSTLEPFPWWSLLTKPLMALPVWVLSVCTNLEWRGKTSEKLYDPHNWTSYVRKRQPEKTWKTILSWKFSPISHHPDLVQVCVPLQLSPLPQPAPAAPHNNVLKTPFSISQLTLPSFIIIYTPKWHYPKQLSRWLLTDVICELGFWNWSLCSVMNTEKVGGAHLWLVEPVKAQSNQGINLSPSVRRPGLGGMKNECLRTHLHHLSVNKTHVFHYKMQ